MSDTDSKYIGTMIKTIRKAAQMTQQELANKLKISAQQIHKYEIGEDNISAKKLSDIADIFCCDVKIFLKNKKSDFNILKVSERKKDFIVDKKTKNDEAILLLKNFFSCDKKNREKIFKLVKEIAKKK